MPDRVIPAEFLTPAKIFRVVVHWTAGGYRPSSTDQDHYHVIIGSDAGHVVVVRGDHSPADNDRTADGDYAAHTKGLNTNSFGLAVACMAGAVAGGTHGRYPMTVTLWERLCQGAAEVLAAYDLVLNDRTCLSHGEVQAVYGAVQRGKWDINELSFDRTLSVPEVHQQMRAKVQWYLETYHGR